MTILVLSLGSCKKKERPDDVMKPDQMQAVLWDVLQANAFVNDFVKKDSGVNIEQQQVKMQMQVFAKHKITKAYFDKSYDWYTKNPAQMQRMLDTLTARAERSKKKRVIQSE